MKVTSGVLGSRSGTRLLWIALLFSLALGITLVLLLTPGSATADGQDEFTAPIVLEEIRPPPKVVEPPSVREQRQVQGQGASITQQATPTPGTLVGNLNGTAVAGTAWDQDRALGFTTGSNDGGYRLTSVQVSFSTAASENLTPYNVRIVNAGNNQPGTTNVGTLESVLLPTLGLNSFTGNVDLNANTTYYFFLDLEEGDGPNTARMRMTSSKGKDSGGLSDWSIGDSFARAPKGFWIGIQNRVKIRINGYAIVPPALESAEVNGTSLVLTFDQNLDTTSRTAARQFGIKFGGGALQNATAISIDGRQVTLTVPEVRAGQVVTVSYTVPTSNPLKGTNGEDVNAFSDQTLKVNTGPAFGRLPESGKVREAVYVTYNNADGEEEVVEKRAASADLETLWDYFYDSCSAVRSLTTVHDYSQYTEIVTPSGATRTVMTQARNGWKWVWVQDANGAVTGTRAETVNECANHGMYLRQAQCANEDWRRLNPHLLEGTCPEDRSW